LPNVYSSIPNSPLAWRLKGGLLDQQPIIDCFGPSSIWSTEGGLWGRSPMLTNLQARHPTPSYLVFVENNEGPYEKIKRYAQLDNRHFNSYGYPLQTWLPSGTLKSLSLRMRDRVADLLKANPNSTPFDFQPE